MYSFDREIFRWFDRFFEDQINRLDVNNFICEIDEYDDINDRKISLEKGNSNYWKLEMMLPEYKYYELKDNVHPVFKQYIFEDKSMYNFDSYYSEINSYINKIMDSITTINFDDYEDSYLIDYNEDFIEKANMFELGKSTMLIDDVYILANSNKNFDLFNIDNTFKLNLNFEPKVGEDLIDSLIDLQKSIFLYKR